MSPIEQAHSLSIQSLTGVLIRHFDLHEGVYQLNVGFKIGVGGFAMDGGPDAVPLPGAVVGVEGVTLTKVPEGVNAPNAVDASLVNPAPKPRLKTRAKKTA
ncbi:MAG: hypothetical protein RIS04_1446 [Pseudomonadota bacterium]|jgi:hypothetical protein|uniref:hypothetical protein n=1 Tax=Limnohabitans sp. TaxID=1907725 RepID=UPI00311F1BA7